MRSVMVLGLTLAFLICSGCMARESASRVQPTSVAPDSGIGEAARNAPSGAGSSNANTNSSATAPLARARGGSDSATGTAGATTGKQPEYEKAAAQQVSLTATDAARSAAVAMDRKIIRNATMTIETAAPADGQRKLARIAESHGGFVVMSDSNRRADQDQSKPEMVITVVARVPATEFAAAMEEIRGVGGRILSEKMTGQDVTEEYIDLEARIRTKKALEAQFLEIMKQAHKVSDALEVQSELAEVRTEIERLEGRKRYLENQSSLSTITVTLEAPAPLVSTSGFATGVRRAFGDGLDVAEGITLFFIRAGIALLPVVVLIFLPMGLLLRFLLQRARRQRLARQLAEEPRPLTET